MQRMNVGNKANPAHQMRLCLLGGAAVLLMVIAVFLTGVLDKQKIWPQVQLDFQGGKTQFSLEAGDAYGVVTGGPYHDLAAGRYRLQWRIDGDGENLIHISCSNGAVITPDVIRTVPGEGLGEAEFELKDAVHNVSFGIEFASGSWMSVHNLRLYSPEYTDRAWTFAFAVLAVWILFALERMGRISDRTWQTLCVIGLAAVMACIPAFRADCLDTHDVEFHAARIMNLADGLRAGQFPVRVGGFSYNGYGAATSVFYPDLLLYPLALMILGGASINYVVQLSCLASSLLSGWIMYAAAKRFLKDHAMALCAALLYVLSVFRLEGMFTRYMLGEMTAMTVLPLFLLGLWEVVAGDWRRWPLLTLGATLIFQSHMCTTLLCALLAACVCAASIRKLVKERARLGAIAAAAGTTLLINLGTLLPFAMLYLGGVNTPTDQFGFVESAFSVRDLIVRGEGIGQLMWPGILAAMGAVVIDREKENRNKAVVLLVLTGVTALLTTNLIPWARIVEWTNGLVEVIQFPWRFLGLATAFAALCGGYGIVMLLRGSQRAAVLATLLVTLLGTWPFTLGVMEKSVRIGFGNGANPYMVFPEYQYEGTDVHDTRSREVLIQGDVQLTQYRKRGTQVDAQVNAASDAQLTFPMFGFDGYRVELSAEKIDWRRGENNRLTIDLPAGTMGTLRIRYEGFMVWRIAEIISLLSAIGLGIYVRRRRVMNEEYVCKAKEEEKSGLSMS